VEVVLKGRPSKARSCDECPEDVPEASPRHLRVERLQDGRAGLAEELDVPPRVLAPLPSRPPRASPSSDPRVKVDTRS